MLVSDYISKDFIPPKLNQSVAHALDLMQTFNLTHIPVFEGLNFVGSFSKETLENQTPELKLAELKEFVQFFYITSGSSLLESIQNFHTYETNLLVVLNSELHYVGLLLMEDVISELSTMPFIAEPGALLVVEVAQKNYSISEISKIAESNNARIIGLFVTAYEHGKVRVAIKMIAENLASLGETFERFDYTVLHKFFVDEKEDLMKDRFDMLMKYLDI